MQINYIYSSRKLRVGLNSNKRNSIKSIGFQKPKQNSKKPSDHNNYIKSISQKGGEKARKLIYRFYLQNMKLLEFLIIKILSKKRTKKRVKKARKLCFFPSYNWFYVKNCKVIEIYNDKDYVEKRTKKGGGWRRTEIMLFLNNNWFCLERQPRKGVKKHENYAFFPSYNWFYLIKV